MRSFSIVDKPNQPKPSAATEPGPVGMVLYAVGLVFLVGAAVRVALTEVRASELLFAKTRTFNPMVELILSGFGALFLWAGLSGGIAQVAVRRR